MNMSRLLGGLAACVFTITLPAGQVVAANVSIELSGGDFGCCVNASDPVSVSGSISNSVTSQPTASAEANVTTGIIRASAETNAWNDGSPNLVFGQARAQLDVTFTNTDPLTAYEIFPGEIGLQYDASYLIDQQNVGLGTAQFQLRLDAFLRDDTGTLVGGVRRAWINHIVTFNETSIWDNVPGTTAPNLKTEINGGMVDAFITGNSIAGTLTFDSLMLSPGYTLDLSLLLFAKADATVKPGVTDIALFPSAAVDAENTAQFFFNNPGLTPDTTNPLQWPSSPTIVPLPAAVWLFGSGLLGLIGVARRKKAA